MRVRLPLVCAVALVLVVRFAGLTAVPPAGHTDEYSIGWNAWSVATTGADEHGRRLPLYFEAFGEWKNPVFVYALVPFVRVLGPSLPVLRLVAALHALGVALLLAWIAREWLGTGEAGWTAFLLAGLLPWLFLPGRVAFEAISFPFWLCLGIGAWVRGARGAGAGWMGLSGLSFGVSLFSYSTARLMTPALVLALVLSHLPGLRGRAKSLSVFGLAFLVPAAVLGGWMIAHPGALTERLGEIGVWRDGAGAAVVAGRIARGWVECLSPEFLFTRGDACLRHHTGRGGMLFVVLLPALLAGIAEAVRRRREPFARFLLAGFALFPLAATLTIPAEHALRTLHGAPFAVLLCVLGVGKIVEWTRGRSALRVVLLVAATLEAGLWFADAATEYPGRARAWFKAGLAPAVEEALVRREGPLFYSPYAFRDEKYDRDRDEIHFLYLGLLDPGVFRERGLAGFGIREWDGEAALPPGSLLLLKDAEELHAADGRVFLVATPHAPPPGAVEVAAVRAPGPDPAPVYRIYRVP